MSLAVEENSVTPEQYLEAERTAEYKSEYFGGEIFAMSGASRKHNLITFNISGILHRQLKGRACEAYTNDMRVKVSPTGLYTYPDVLVVCGEPVFDDAHKDTLLNPTLIIEVLSGSTEAYDRGKKFENYRTVLSISDYLLIAQNKCVAEHYVRQADGSWLFSEYKNLKDTVHVVSIECDMTLEEIYEKIKW